MEANQNQDKHIYVYFGIWLILVIIGFIAGIIITDGLQHYRLMSRGVEIQGRVTDKEPKQHNHVHYSYTVEKQTYNKIGMASRSNPPFEKIKIGDPLIVYYDPDEPSVSCSGNPESYFQDSVIGVAFLTVIFPLFAMFSLYIKGYLKPNGAVQQIKN